MIGVVLAICPYALQAGTREQHDLANVLEAYACFRPEVGYCQGLSFIVATLLTWTADADAHRLVLPRYRYSRLVLVADRQVVISYYDSIRIANYHSSTM